MENQIYEIEKVIYCLIFENKSISYKIAFFFFWKGSRTLERVSCLHSPGIQIWRNENYWSKNNQKRNK